MDIPGYSEISVLHEGANSTVFRAYGEQEHRPVVLKILSRDYPTASEMHRYRNEFEILSQLKDAACPIQALDLHQLDSRPVLVLESFPAPSLRTYLDQGKKFSLREVLSIGSQLTAGLAEIHAMQVIHKDVNPANILWDMVSSAVRIIDFSAASSLFVQNPLPVYPGFVQGSLRYFSPEQTGRTSWVVDARTDFYSLGATLYELLVGNPPFVSDDAMELIHQLLVVTPAPPSQQDPSIPVIISDLVLKLLAKSPDDRYQTALGLKADLDRCSRELRSGGQIETFELAGEDFPEHLLIPQRLYGRDAEIQKIFDGFERTDQGQKQLLLISGDPGVGKTALIQEIYKPISHSPGHFISGRFEPLHRETPYAALAMAFGQFAQQLLTEPQQELERWRERILHAIGNVGKILLDLVPELEPILGPQPAIVDLPADERQNRFHVLIQKFVGVLATPACPLVMFIDDLQWADQAFLKMFRLLMTSSEIQSLYFIGAFRDTEVAVTHPLISTLTALGREGCAAMHLHLDSLQIPDINRLLADTLRRAPAETEPLAVLLHKRTEGNPLFVRECLREFALLGLLVPVPARRHWSFDLAGIQEQEISDQVAELMQARIAREDGEIQEALKCAACVGNQFDLEMLRTVAQEDPNNLIHPLRLAIAAGYLISLGETFEISDRSTISDSGMYRAEFRFAHNRIQQAAYQLIPEAKRAQIHLQIGRLLLARCQADKGELKLFELTNHLNQAIDLIDEPSERGQLARLNLQAARKAKESAAASTALGYLEIGLGLLAERCWEEEYELTLAMHEEAAECAYLAGDYDRMERWIAQILPQARSLFDRMTAYSIRIAACTAEHKNQLAIEIGLKTLEELGLRFPARPTRLHLLWELLWTRFSLLGKQVERIAELPPMTDPHVIRQIQIMRSISTAVYLAAPQLIPILLLRQVRLLLRHGHTAHSPTILGTWGYVLCGVIGDIATGYQVGKLVPILLDRLDAAKSSCRANFLFNAFTRHWKEPLANTLPGLKECYTRGIETGDIQFAAFAAHIYCHYSFLLGKELTTLLPESRGYTVEIGNLRQESAHKFNLGLDQTMLNLLGQVADPHLLTGEAFNEWRDLPLLHQVADHTALFGIYCMKLILCYLFKDFESAVLHADEAHQHIDAVSGYFGVTRFYAYDSLARLALARSARPSQVRAFSRTVTRNQRKLKRWAFHAPFNHLHLYRLVEAERCFVRGEYPRAHDLYDQAISLAKQHGFLNDEALAIELAAECFYAEGNLIRCRSYFREAHYTYLRWGALAKVRDLEQRFGILLERTESTADRLQADTVTMTIRKSQDTGHRSMGNSPSISIEQGPLTSTESSQSASTMEELLDFTSIIKASQSISGEIELNTLLMKLMKILGVTAGVDKALLILTRGGIEELSVEARVSVDQNPQVEILSTPLEKATGLSTRVVLNVARSKRSLLLADQQRVLEFGHDPYLEISRPKSLLALPVLRHGKLMGVLYLENHRISNLFTESRIEVLRLLATQAAISIDNAQLYKQLQGALQRAEETDRLKSELLSRTSHELRTPLNGIINIPLGIIQNYLRDVLRCEQCQNVFELDGPIEAIEQTPCPSCAASGRFVREKHLEAAGHAAEIEELLLSIANCGWNLESLILELLDMSLLKSGRMSLQLKEVVVQDLLTRVVQTLSIESLKAENKVSVELPALAPGLCIQADLVSLEKALTHLICNAIKFSPRGGTVTVGLTLDQEQAIFSIQDRGVGIPKDLQPRIFDGFYQVESGATRRFGGLGLGLAISKTLVELHGGSLSVESEENQGSTFLLKLPYHHPLGDR